MCDGEGKDKVGEKEELWAVGGGLESNKAAGQR